MGVKPGKPCRLLNPTFLRHMHAEMEILVKEVIEAEGRHPAKENVHLEKMLDPKKQGDMQTENHRRVPPSEADLFEILVVRADAGRPRTEDAVVDQGMGIKDRITGWSAHQG